MDRRQSIRIVFILGVALFLSASCAGFRGVSVNATNQGGVRPSGAVETSPQTESDSTHDIATFDSLVEELASKPEESFSGVVPAAVESEIGSEFHLSADTGWLVLPVPRLTDDLNQPDVPRLTAGSGRLHLPVPPVATASRTAGTRRTDHENEQPFVESGSLVIASTPPRTTRTQALAPDSEEGAFLRSLPHQPSETRQTAEPGQRVEIAVASASDRLESARVSAFETAPVEGRVPRAPDPAETGSRVGGPILTVTPVAEAPVAPVTAVIGSWVPAALSGEIPVRVTLPGSGWFYVGSEYGDGDADLVIKTNDRGDDEFRFLMSNAGDYGLWFQREDAVTGEISNERLLVAATDESRALGHANGGGITSSGEQFPDSGAARDPVGAGDILVSTAGTDSSVIDSGAFQLPASVDTDTESDWRVAAREAISRGDRLSAGEVYAKVIAGGGDAAGEASRRFFELATDGADAALLADAIVALHEHGGFGHVERVAALQALGSAANQNDTVRAYEALVTTAENARGLDSLLFELATALREPGDLRDLRRARELYERIVRDYPLSGFWDQSSAAIEYLDRHFFDVR